MTAVNDEFDTNCDLQNSVVNLTQQGVIEA